MSTSVTSPFAEKTIKEFGTKDWSIWTCDASSFDLIYYDKVFLESEVTVTPKGEEPFSSLPHLISLS